ncbi:MAG: alanine racemase [Treponema sp.]|nr:alanine racemase [Treponema sp.]
MNRCTKAILYKDNLRYNLEQIKKYVGNGTKICVAVKADGYGHNAIITSQIAQELGIDYLAVATVDEALELRNAGIKTNILLLSICTPFEMPDLFEYKITPLVFGTEYIDLLKKAADTYCENQGIDKKFDVHLAVDTGMGRIGCYPQEAGEQAKLIQSTKHLKLGGMCTHFAVSDSLEKANQDFTKVQFDQFKTAVENVKKEGIDPGICSCGASAALLNNQDMHFDMVRPGIITYGYYPDQITHDYLVSAGKNFDIKPVLALETKVVAIRHFPKDKSVSYGRTWTAEEPTDIAVLPIGYADGLLRRFSPGLEVTINGKNYPVRGRICMDQCMVEIGQNNKDVHLWDKVLIFGPKESGALNTADDLARIGNTISYEVLTSITKRVQRVIE